MDEDHAGSFSGGNDGFAVDSQFRKHIIFSDFRSSALIFYLSEFAVFGSFCRVEGFSGAFRFGDGDLIDIEFVGLFEVARTQIDVL